MLCENNTGNIQNNLCNKPYAISVCRIEPENNIHLVLDAFSSQTEIPLIAIGNWKNSDYGLELVKKHEQFENIYLLDPIYDFERINFLRSNAFLYMHGHSAGGTNPSLVEAMFFGLPVFAFDCVYNRYTTENQCVYWSSADQLKKYILNIQEFDLQNIGVSMKNIAARKYRWKIITEKYQSLFFK